MEIQVKDQIDKYSLQCSIKYSLPYLLFLFLFAVWLLIFSDPLRLKRYQLRISSLNRSFVSV